MLDDDARLKRADEPARVFDVKSPARPAGARGGAEDRRVALRGLPPALRRGPGRTRRATACRTRSTPTLVRGLDYYTRTTFEFVGPDASAQSTICGGGRYDGLVEQIGGPPTPGIGFGAGLERLLLALENEGVTAPRRALDVFFVVDGGAARAGPDAAWPSCVGAGSPATPTTPAARSRGS